ncbi:unnamed protein product [Choristocarpus tenellus]
MKTLLDRITSIRAHLIDATKDPRWAKAPFLTHVIGPLILIIVVIATFLKTRKLNLFSLHPICMSLAFVVLMPEGIVAYRNTFLLDVFSPIMQHGSKFKKRTIHMTIQLMMAGFAGLGLMFIVANKLYIGTTSIPHTLHAILGSLVLMAIVMQGIVGNKKYGSLTTGVIDSRNRGKKYRWHGKMGLLVYDASVVVMGLGIASFFGSSTTSLVVILLMVYLWLNVNLQMHESRHMMAPMRSVDDGEEAVGSDVEENQKLAEEGGVESKGQQVYPE